MHRKKQTQANQAVRNNPDKFPFGYLFELDKYEKAEVVKKFDHFKKLKFSKVTTTKADLANFAKSAFC